MRNQAIAADNPATHGVTQFAADFTQGAALGMPAAHGLAQLRIDPPEIGRGVLDEAAHLGHVRHVAQALQFAVGSTPRKVVDIGASGQAVGIQGAPGEAVIGTQADVTPIQVQVRHRPGFVAAAAGVVGLIAEARAHVARDAFCPRGTAKAPPSK